MGWAPCRTLLVFLAGCAFSPSALPPGSTPDAPVGPVADSALADASIDGSVIDAMSMIDAAVDECVGGSTALASSTTPAAFAAPAGGSVFTSDCAATNASESRFHIDVSPPGDDYDLVVDLAESPAGGTADMLLDVNRDCQGSSTPAQCADDADQGQGEVVVIPDVAAGRHYIVVDTFGNGTPSAYDLRWFLRPVVGALATCDPFLVGSRCSGSYCLDSAVSVADSPVCTALPTIVTDEEANDSCATADVVNGDAVFAGASPAPSDDDWIHLNTPVDVNFGFRAVLYTANGGCDADFRLVFERRSACTEAVLETVTAQSEGLGGCPVLIRGTALGSEHNIVRVERSNNAGKDNPALGYTLVIDYLPAS